MKKTPLPDEKRPDGNTPIPQILLYAVENSSDHVILTDADTIILYANQAAQDHFGETMAALTGSSLKSFWAGPDHQVDEILRHLADGRPWKGLILMKAPGRPVFTEQCTISPQMGQPDGITHFLITGSPAAKQAKPIGIGQPNDPTYRNILNQMVDGYLETDLEGNLTFLNDNAAKIYQWPLEELIGMNYRDYMSPDQADQIFKTFYKVHLTGTSGKIIEYEIIGRDGTRITCETIISMLYDDQGNATGFSGVIRDVSKKVELARQIKESEESYRRVMELAPDAITVTRISDGQYFEVNEKFCSQTGYRRKEVIGRTVDDLKLYVDPEDRQRIIRILQSEDQVNGLRVNFRHKDGSVLHSIISARIIQFKGEECILFIATLINSLIETQKALEESEQRSRLILEAAPDAICLTRMSDAIIVKANQIFFDRTGHDKTEVIGKNALDLHLYAHLSDRENFFSELREKGQVDSMEIMARYKDGSLSPQLWSARKLEWGGQECLLVVAKPIDELKKAQEQLKERENSYKAILDTAPYGIVILRRSDGKYLMVNNAFCKRSGYTPEEAIGKTPLDLDIYADKAQHREMLRVLKRDNRIFGFEITHKAKDGSFFESLLAVTPIVHMGEDCFLTITVNITDQKKAQRKLEQSEESYRIMMESAPNGITILSKPGLNYIAVNDIFCTVTGYTRDEIIGHNAYDLDLFKKPEQLTELIQRVKNDGQLDGMELEIKSRTGRVIDVLTHIIPIRHMGKPCFLSTNVNLTPLKKAQNALRESEARFRSIFETAADAIWVIDPETRQFININQAARQQLGYSADEFRRMRIHDIVDTRYRYPEPALENSKNKFKPVFFEAILIGKYGSRIPVEISSGMLIYSGQPVILSIIRDVSERKRTEAELAQYRRHLEEMVQERTDELKQAQEELVKNEKLSVLGQLTATVSHELRNPLGVIRSSNFYLKQKIREPDEKINKHIQRIDEQVGMCDTIVNDLLEYTRGRQISLTKQTIHPWLKKLIEQECESHQFPIKYNCLETLPRFPHDPDKMRRVVINLIGNAIQAVQARGKIAAKHQLPYHPEITLTLFQDGGAPCMVLKDNGVGMDEETQKHAFEPLFTTRARGTGIGLAIVSKIISEHHGEIRMDSAPDQGTTITIRLPAWTGNP